MPWGRFCLMRRVGCAIAEARRQTVAPLLDGCDGKAYSQVISCVSSPMVWVTLRLAQPPMVSMVAVWITSPLSLVTQVQVFLQLPKHAAIATMAITVRTFFMVLKWFCWRGLGVNVETPQLRSIRVARKGWVRNVMFRGTKVHLFFKTSSFFSHSL